MACAIWSCSVSDDEYSLAHSNLDSVLIGAIHKTNALEFDDAHGRLTALMEESAERGDHRIRILSHINMGVLYLKFNAQDDAIRYFLQASELSDELGNEDFLNTIYNNIGVIYSTNHATGKAIGYYEKALAISRKQKNSEREALNLINLSTEVRRQGETTRAFHYLRESIALFLSNHDTLNAGVALKNMADICYERNQLDSAVILYRTAQVYGDLAGDQYYAPQFLFGLGKTFYAKHVYDSAEKFILKSLRGFERVKNTEAIIGCYEVLANIQKAIRNEAAELDYTGSKLAWQDSLLREKTTKWVSELEMKYQFNKKEEEVKRLHIEARQQRHIWIGVITSGVLISLLIFYAMRTKNVTLLQRNIILQKERELSALTLEKANTEREQMERERLAAEKLNALETQQLRQELMFKDRELAAKALHLVNKNEILRSIHTLLEAINTEQHPGVREQIRKISKIILGNDNMDAEWTDFKRHFEEVHPRFFSQLTESFPSLSGNDLRLSAYLLIDLNAKEIAHIFNISPESVRKKKQRLREKLNLEKEEDIKILLGRFSVQNS